MTKFALNQIKPNEMNIKGIIWKDKETGIFCGKIQEMPEVISQGKTEAEAKKSLIECLEYWLKFKANQSPSTDPLDVVNEFNILQQCQ